MKIHILGAAGTGTSSVGKHIAQKFNMKHIESDYYAWKQTNPPFQEYQDSQQSKKLLCDLFENEKHFILSGSIAKWGKEFAQHLDLVIFLTSPLRVRLKRLKQREKELYGTRINVGGDMHQNFLTFIEFAKNYSKGDLSFRSLALHKKFLTQDVSCPVLRISTNNNKDEVLAKIDKKISELVCKLPQKKA